MTRMRFSFRKRHEPATEVSVDAVEGASASDAELVARLASAHLPDEVRVRWLELLRPAVQLVPVGDHESAVGRLGGLPALPSDVPWPDWVGHGPLSYIGELECDSLAQFELDLPIPKTGRLLFFYFDGSFDDFATTVGTWDASSLQGARMLHLADVTAASPRPAPDGITVYPERVVAGRPIVTSPGWEHPDLREAFMEPGQDERSFLDHPVNADAFMEVVYERRVGPVHQVGGYAQPVQGPVEHEVAQAALDNQVGYRDPRLEAEALRWELLLQVDSDDDLNMMWGDVGTLYWMVRPEDLANDDLTQVSFTWQCG